MVKYAGKPPSKELCLRMSELHFNTRANHENHTSWIWLICWGFYDMYIEGWSND